MPMAMSESSHSQETMSMWQLGTLHGWEQSTQERQHSRPPGLFDPSFDVSQMYPPNQETHPEEEFGFFDTRGYF